MDLEVSTHFLIIQSVALPVAFFSSIFFVKHLHSLGHTLKGLRKRLTLLVMASVILTEIKYLVLFYPF